MQTTEKKKGKPIIKDVHIFREVVINFTDPREIFREAISNSLDHGATNIRIKVYEDASRADKELVIVIWDNGIGLSKERFHAFWNLSDSPKLADEISEEKRGKRVGEKGHGTKTYWKCRVLEVESISNKADGTSWHVWSEMREPINSLLKAEAEMKDELPDFEWIDQIEQGKETFTEITIRGYQTDDKEYFRHEAVLDYILWFTKFGSIELECNIDVHKNDILELQGLGKDKPEHIKFGHVFPPVSNNIQKLKSQWKDSWPNYYVNKWVYASQTIEGYPGSKIDIVFYLEGDSVKRDYNQMLSRPGRTKERWHYTVTERYGLYVCKDYIPLDPSQRVNEWIAEKSEYTLYHAFVNCQDFYLTANRASIGNTDGNFLVKVEQAVQKIFRERIQSDLHYKAYQEEIDYMKRQSRIERTEAQEKSDIRNRFNYAKAKKVGKYSCLDKPTVVLMEPRQEAEVLIIYSIVSAVKPSLFPFKIVDYSTSAGIDALCILESGSGGLQEGNLRYVEFKKALTHQFRDHTFSRLAGVVCWECNLENGAEISDLAGSKRKLHKTSKDGETIYMLPAPPDVPGSNIQVYVLKQILADRLGIKFETPIA